MAYARACLLALLLVATTDAMQIQKGSDDAESPEPRWKQLFSLTAINYAAVTIATSPLTEPSGVESVLLGLRVPSALRSVVLAACRFLYRIRQDHTAVILIGHEAFTGMTADVLAQSIEGWHHASGESSSSSAGADGDDNAHDAHDGIDVVRVARTTTVSLVSDDLPFLLWSRYLWLAAERFKASVRGSSLAPGLVRALTNPVSMTLGKTAITRKPHPRSHSNSPQPSPSEVTDCISSMFPRPTSPWWTLANANPC